MTAVVEAPPIFLCSAACPLAGGNLSVPNKGCIAYSSLWTAYETPTSGLITTPMADVLEARGARYIQKLLPPPVAIRMYPCHEEQVIGLLAAQP